jgi:glycosidase
MKKISIVLLFLISFYTCFSSPIKRIEPQFWWTGMKNPELQVLIYGDRIADWKINLSYAGVNILRTVYTSNPNYTFLYLNIGADAKPGTMNFNFTKGKEKFSQPYELKQRTRNPDDVKGFDDNDLLYLIMPDRFSNGDPSNDSIPGLLEGKVDRINPGGRHGGDLQGIINHLDYIQNLGVTTVWLNPVQTNDEPKYSYHGYAATDLYHVDPRYGGNDEYVRFVSEAHKRELKVIMDYVYNHVGNQAWFIKDLPSPTWIHQWPEFTRSNYRPASALDLHASQYDVKQNLNGWFDTHMDDLDQTDPLLADFLIQSTIWWVEFAGIDGYRIDTYPYPDNNFMNECLRRLYAEYPNINVVGETWEQLVPFVAYWQKNTPLRKADSPSELESITDFPMSFAMKDGLKENFGWTTGECKIYYTLAQDALYGDPSHNMIFLDNHDVSRIYSELGEDFSKWKQAIALLMTMRGIPCLYYGTEILMSGVTNPDGLVRKDFPGGWANDSLNKFTAAGRTQQENDAFNYVKKLADFRKAYPEIVSGKLLQFVPQEDVYVYFRYTDKQCVMVLLNTSSEQKNVDTKRFAERMQGYKSAIEVNTGGLYSDLSKIPVDPHGVMIMLMKNE